MARGLAAQQAVDAALGFMAPFDRDTRDDRLPYRFVMPGVAISGDEDVALDFDTERGQWHVIQTQGELRWEVWADGKLEAVLSLIARRWGLMASFEPAPDQQP